MQGRRKVEAWGALAPPMFGRTVNPISTRGADYARHSTTSPPKFSDLATALNSTHYLKGLYVDKGNKKQKFTEKY